MTQGITSSTRWCGEVVVLDTYEDIAELVTLARRARKCNVEFDWVLTREDLVRLQRLLYEQGRRVVGRYKTFNARILGALRDALGDANTTYVLTEPRAGRWVDAKVTCLPDHGVFHLYGHAPFDLVFGKGETALDRSSTAGLSTGARQSIIGCLKTLGWDLPRLQEERFRPVRNALYGMPLANGIETRQPSTEPAQEVTVRFQGPFTAIEGGECPCLFTTEIAKRTGVYLWSIMLGGRNCPWYVGQTRVSFATRTAQHVRSMIAGEYLTYDAEALARGVRRFAKHAPKGPWPERLGVFLRNYEDLTRDIIGAIRLVRFHFAPVNGDAHLYNRIEGAIARYYKQHTDAELKDLFGAGIKVPAAVPFDRPIRLALSSEAPIAGLPTEILE